MSRFDNYFINSTIKSNDTINKHYDSCGCIIISELNLLENIIIEKHIQFCKSHYKIFIKKNKNNNLLISNINYIYNKKNNKYIFTEKSVPKLNKQKSYENIQTILLKTHSPNNTSNNFSEQILNFGKYKNKTYEYVYCNDKIYCYNLAFWKNTNFKNKKILNFIKYIKNQILLETNNE